MSVSVFPAPGERMKLPLLSIDFIPRDNVPRGERGTFYSLTHHFVDTFCTVSHSASNLSVKHWLGRPGVKVKFSGDLLNAISVGQFK